MSQYGFDELGPEYDRLIPIMHVTDQHAVDQAVRTIEPHLDVYRATSKATGIPTAWIAAIDYRESDCKQSTGIGQGDRWDRVSVNRPSGKGPFASKADADKYYLHYDHIDLPPPTPDHQWIQSYAGFEAEAWNGMGPRKHGRHSGYPWGATNIYNGGHYVSDGKWDANARETRAGTVPIIQRLGLIHPDLNIPLISLSPPVEVPVPLVIPPPQPVPEHLHEAMWVQASLNKLGAKPLLDVDDNYGRQTRMAVKAYQKARGLDVDGIVGPVTRASIERDLAKLPT